MIEPGVIFDQRLDLFVEASLVQVRLVSKDPTALVVAEDVEWREELGIRDVGETLHKLLSFAGL